MQTEISFVPPTTNVDGSAINEPLSYTAFIDTVNPPAKAYPVLSTASTLTTAGITVLFSQLGFAPVNGTTYFVDVTATDASGTSTPSGVVQFAYSVPPSAPTGLKVF